MDAGSHRLVTSDRHKGITSGELELLSSKSVMNVAVQPNTGARDLVGGMWPGVLSAPQVGVWQASKGVCMY